MNREYRAIIEHVVGAGSLEISLDIDPSIPQVVRLARIVAPEAGSPAAEQAVLFLSQFVDQEVVVHKVQDTPFTVEIVAEYNYLAANLSDLLVHNGYAVLREDGRL